MADHAPSGADLLFSSAEIGVGRRNRFVFLPIGRRSREDLCFEACRAPLRQSVIAEADALGRSL